MTTFDTYTDTPARQTPVRAITEWLAKRRQRLIDRRAFQRMLALDTHMLRDIGVSRAEVEWAASLPLSRNAAVELEGLRRQSW